MRVLKYFNYFVICFFAAISIWLNYYVIKEVGPLWQISNNQKTVAGTLIEIEEERSYEDGMVDVLFEEYVYFPVIEYVVNNEYFRIRGEKTFDKDFYFLGTKEKIVYNTLNPQHAFHGDRVWKEWMILVILLLTSFVTYWSCYAVYRIAK